MAKLLLILAGFFVCGTSAKGADEGVGKQPPRPEAVRVLREHGPDGLAQALHTYDGLVQDQSQQMFSCFVAPEKLSPNGEHNLDACAPRSTRSAGNAAAPCRGCFGTPI